MHLLHVPVTAEPVRWPAGGLSESSCKPPFWLHLVQAPNEEIAYLPLQVRAEPCSCSRSWHLMETLPVKTLRLFLWFPFFFFLDLMWSPVWFLVTSLGSPGNNLGLSWLYLQVSWAYIVLVIFDPKTFPIQFHPQQLFTRFSLTLERDKRPNESGD